MDPTGPTPAADATPAESDIITPRSLAELARAGFSIVRQPLMRVAYEVHHVHDRPGYLSDLLRTPRGADGPSDADPVGDQQPERFAETLTTSAYGTGLVIGAQTVSAGIEHASLQAAASPIGVVDVPGSVRWFSGLAVPNVSFSYEASNVFEGLIAVGDAEEPLQSWHARVILEVLAEVGELAAGIAKSPILSLQSPVQLPPQAYANREGSDAWPTSAAVAVRFSIALHRPTASSRLELLKHASEFCTERGLAFWAADARSGPRAGNWFAICEADPARRRGHFGASAAEATAPRWSLPITFVGPARVGATRSVIRYLEMYDGVGVVACSMSIVDDVAFIHLHLTNVSEQRDDAAMNMDLDGITNYLAEEAAARFDPVELLPLVLPALGAPSRSLVRDAEERCTDLKRRVADFHMLVGRVKAMPTSVDMRRRALWLSWEVEGREAELSAPFQALHSTLRELLPEWSQPRADDDGPNIEYLICRRVRHAILRGKGKVSLPDRIRPTVVTGDLQADLARLCEHIEAAWRAKLKPERPARELTVSWRENWLGHWTSPLE